MSGVRTKTGAMASFKKSFEGLRASKGATDTAVQAAQDAVQQAADASRETAGAAAEEAGRQTQAAIGKAADRTSDAIKEFGLKMENK